MGVELRFITPNSQLFYTFSLLRNLKIGCGSLKKVQINLASRSPCTIFAASEGEILGSRMRFLLLPENRNRQFQERGGNNATLILFAYMQAVYSLNGCTHFPHICYSVGYLFLSSFSHGVWRYQIFDELDKSLRFSCIC